MLLFEHHVCNSMRIRMHCYMKRIFKVSKVEGGQASADGWKSRGYFGICREWAPLLIRKWNLFFWYIKPPIDFVKHLVSYKSSNLLKIFWKYRDCTIQTSLQWISNRNSTPEIFKKLLLQNCTRWGRWMYTYYIIRNLHTYEGSQLKP